MLQQLTKLPDLNNIPFVMTDEEFVVGMKLVSEGKTSLMSGQHYSIYKALIQFPYTTRIIVSLINNCVANNYVLDHWKKVVQVMLCKIPGNFSIGKLRVIQLLEADLNMFLCLTWGKKLVRNAIKHSLFRAEQLGSCPGFAGSSAPLLKILSFDHIRILRANANIFNNDLSACYDRILAYLAQLCCQRLGLPSEAVKFILIFLSTAEYHIKTLYGTSNKFYTNTMKAIYGVLQGSGLASAIWLAVSLLLNETYVKKFPTHGTPNPTDTDRIIKIIDAFVDDTNLWDILYNIHLSIEDQRNRTQSRAQYWARIINLTGGKLNLSKCHWYMVRWKWQEDGFPEMQEIDDTPATLTLSSYETADFQEIKRLNPSKPLKTLGVYTSPVEKWTYNSRKQKKHFNQLRQQSKNHASPKGKQLYSFQFTFNQS